MNGKLRRFIVAALVTLAGLTVSVPVHAVDRENYSNRGGSPSAKLRPTSTSRDAPAKVHGTAGVPYWWDVQVAGRSPSGHTLVFLKSAASMTPGPRCLDSHASGHGGDAWVISCNGGTFQMWEVFHTDSNTIAFKSWGAWKEQGRHLCLALGSNSRAVLKNCNINNDRTQLWY